MSSERIDALQRALALAPADHTLRLLLAELLQAAGRHSEALEHYGLLLQERQLPRELIVPTGQLALQVEEIALASRCLDEALKAGVVDGVAALRARLDEKLAEQGFVRVVQPVSAAPAPFATVETQAPITFAEVGGLAEVKKVIHKMIILPLLRPDIYRKYGKQAGGGVLMYGPPGCGKTMLARATAGECGLPFINIRIEEILDPWFGVSERNLHMAFSQARAAAPCVVFLDELDAIAFARRKQHSNTGRSLVDQLLQEMDAIGAENSQLLILAATNAPWDVDEALLRPGRFDRRIFVPPPDEEARHDILKRILATVPNDGPDLKRLAKATGLFSGADLRALVNQAVDQIIDEALESNREIPITTRHLETARAELRPTTLEWLGRAQNFVEFANQDDRYKEIALYLRSADVRQWRGKKG